LNQRLHRLPFGIVGHLKDFLVAIHHALLHLCRVKVAPALPSAAPLPAVIRLRDYLIGTQTHYGGDSRHYYPLVYSHNFYLML
jgi:hypothetical protein